MQGLAHHTVVKRLGSHLLEFVQSGHYQRSVNSAKNNVLVQLYTNLVLVHVQQKTPQGQILMVAGIKPNQSRRSN